VAKPSMDRLIINPTRAGATRNVAPMVVRAGRLISMPKDGNATRNPNSKVKLVEAGGMRTSGIFPGLKVYGHAT
jgi:hypothetical protein